MNQKIMKMIMNNFWTQDRILQTVLEKRCEMNVIDFAVKSNVLYKSGEYYIITSEGKSRFIK